jgi:hypothetical protein
MSLRDHFKNAAAQAKNAANFLLNEAQEKLKRRNAQAEEAVRQQINLVANGKKPLRTYRQPLTDDSPALQSHVLVMNAVLNLFVNERTTASIKNFMTESEHKLVEQSLLPDGRKKLAFWNEKTGARDNYEEIFTEKSSGGVAQFTSYYSPATCSIIITLDGTIFTDIDDLKSAAQLAIEAAASMRMVHVKDCIDNMVSAFDTLYPGKLAKTPIDIYAHSAGAGSVILANYFLQRGHDLVPRAQIMFDPFGAKSSFEILSKIIAEAEGDTSDKILAILSRNTVSFKPKHFSLIDSFKNLHALNPKLGNASTPIGTVKTADVRGNSFTVHRIKSWIRYFSNAEIAEATAAPSRNPFKKFGRKP